MASSVFTKRFWIIRQYVWWFWVNHQTFWKSHQTFQFRYWWKVFQMIRQYVWWFWTNHQTFSKIVSNVWWADGFWWTLFWGYQIITWINMNKHVWIKFQQDLSHQSQIKTVFLNWPTFWKENTNDLHISIYVKYINPDIEISYRQNFSKCLLKIIQSIF